jgi:hypothetical protein
MDVTGASPSYRTWSLSLALVPLKYKLSKIAGLGAWCWCIHDEERRPERNPPFFWGRVFHGIRYGMEAVNNPFNNSQFDRPHSIQHSYAPGTLAQN